MPRAAMSLAILNDFLAERTTPATCASEAAFHALWHERGFDRLSPTDAALAGGLAADRLAWVFAGGYQATLRHAFPMLAPSGWAAFVATEDTHDPAAHPGTRLDEVAGGYALSGYKSWVGHSRLARQLIVTVNDPAGDKYRARGMVVERDRVGVTLTHREKPAFLAALSQGFAHFDATPVAADEVFAFAPMREFGRTEAKFVMLASTAFMLARAAPPLADELVALSGAMLALLAEQDTSRRAYAAIDRQYQRLVDAFETACTVDDIPSWAADRRMLRMYSARIQRRAERREGARRP